MVVKTYPIRKCSHCNELREIGYEDYAWAKGNEPALSIKICLDCMIDLDFPEIKDHEETIPTMLKCGTCRKRFIQKWGYTCYNCKVVSRKNNPAKKKITLAKEIFKQDNSLNKFLGVVA